MSLVDPRNQEIASSETPVGYFTVSLIFNKKLRHYLVKANSALDALEQAQKQLAAPAVSVHLTEYSGYLETIEDATVTEPKTESTN